MLRRTGLSKKGIVKTNLDVVALLEIRTNAIENEKPTLLERKRR